jgi:curved DNA-binding protein
MLTDHYSTLGVPNTATPEEIKTAYRRLANQYHPDKGGDEEMFKNVQIAYSILNDPSRKLEYDRNPQGSEPWFEFQRGKANMHNMHPDEMFRFFQQGAPDPFSFFFNRPQQQRNLSLNVSTVVTLEEAFYGKDWLAEVTLPSGRSQTINIKIPSGIQDGTMLKIQGLGDDSIPHVPRGDIQLTVQVAAHREYVRQGDDLVKQINVMCVEAMLGCKLNVDTIDGRTLEVTINPGTQHGQTLSAQGYGMPNINDNRFRGRLLMPINIEIPTQLTPGQVELLSKFHQS